MPGIAIPEGGSQLLKSYVSRIEALSEEKDGLTADIKDIMLEAKSTGFDPKIIRKVIKLRKMDKAAIEEETALTDLYLSATGA